MTDTADDLTEVAITGMAGRFPGAPDLDAFWRQLARGEEGVSALTDEESRASGVDPALLERPDYVRAKGVLDGGDLFDAAFFGYSPREAEIMDPQHRVFLECAWEALESAGVDPRTFEGRVGVFAGAGLNSYLLFNVMRSARARESAGDYQVMLGGDKDFLATRVSYKLDLKGPSLTVQTACSTSLTAVHLACQALLAGECDIAVAGGVSVGSPLRAGYLYEPGGILAQDGHCRPFGAGGGGTVPGNGAGAVVLRRLPEALDAGDVVDAVIRGTAVNNDGSLKAGYTAPSVEGQAEVIAEALAVAGVDADSIGYVEAHGTGTALGDPIEIAALTRAYREHTERRGYCAIGSVKGNVGHLDAAAGVTALIKTVLALRHETIPPSLLDGDPAPGLALEDSPFALAVAARPWPRGAEPRRAGVSSFGIGGTNVHLVLEEPPATPDTPDAAKGAAGDAVHVLPLSARTPQALAAAAGRLAEHLRTHPGLDLADVAHTLTRRRAFECRGTVVARTAEVAAGALDELTPAEAVTAAAGPAPVAFLFPGQGTQHVHMARELYAHEPRFTAVFDRCAELFRAHLGEDLRTLVFPPPGGEESAARRLEQTSVTQPVLFAVEYALARLWESWGVVPRAMVGHSVGEYTAACLAGVFSLEDAVRLVAARGRLVQAMEPGAMLAVFLPERETLALLGDELSLAAVNSSRLCVVSGPEEAVEELRQKLAVTGVATRRLHTSHAFHSPSMDGAVRPFVDEVRTVELNAPTVPFCSNVTGTWITDAQATSPAYWGSHLRETVRFADCLDVLLADPELVLLETGPGDALRTFAREHRAFGAGRALLGSLPHPGERRDDREVLRAAWGGLWSAGVPVQWGAADPEQRGRLIRLPGYPFQRKRYWIEPDADAAAAASPSRPASADGVDDFFLTPGWRRLPEDLRPGTPSPASWAVLGADSPLGALLAERLETAGSRVLRVHAGEELVRGEGTPWTAHPRDREHLAAALREAGTTAGDAGLRVLHLWSLEAEPGAGERPDAGSLSAARRAGFDSLLALAQAVGDAEVPGSVAVEVLCRGLHAVTGDEALQPENATLLGACTVLPQEVADATCRSLDVTGLDLTAPGEPAVDAVLGLLARETEDRELALRGRHWWVRDFDPVPLPAPAAAESGLRDGGVYLVTGGLGGVGLAHAEHIARTATGPVLGLLGRSAFPAEADWDAHLADHGPDDPTAVRIRRLRRLTELGSRVVVLRADVTDEEETARAVAELRRIGGGPVNGVVHAAGLPSNGMMSVKTAEDADAVFAAKTHGTLVLDRVCAGDPLDFLLLCSSLTGVVGGPGQSDYCGANAFLDAYAEWRRRDGGVPVTSVAWDTWNGVGMAAGLLDRFGGDATGEPTGHPLLRLVRTEENARTYVTTFSTAESWIVDDHRIMGHGLVPGTAYLELVRAAAAEQAEGRDVELHDVLFMVPVVVPDGQTREVFTTVERRDDGLRFVVRSRTADGGDGAWQEHANGSVSFHEPAEDPAGLVRDLAELRERCEVTEVIETEAELSRRLRLDRFERGSDMEFSFGPRWRCLRSIHTGERRLLATLRLDDAFAADAEDYALHPALLDVAGGTARIHTPDAYYLPFTYRSLRVHAGLTPTIHCYVELREADDSSGETMTCDIDVLDPEGRLLVRIGDFTIKRINDVTGLREQIDRVTAEDAGADPAEEEFSTLRALGEGIAEADGTAALARVLAAPRVPARLLVSGKDFAAVRRLARAVTPALLAEEAGRLAPTVGTHPRPELDTPFVAPRGEDEEAVAAIWRDVLGVEEIGVDDDFFALGGHSLAAVRIGAQIQTRFGRELSMRDFFSSPTVAHTVVLLNGPAGTAGAAADDAIEVLSRDEPPAAAEEDVNDLTDEEVEAQLRALLADEAADDTEDGDDAR
ncbi:type I polyketide synthase [Streptomyces sp. WMMC897]|uniref:type I polyketide synthase n=1 Tax=Streptomyces sp. WMMC897 TaxID=3014782 RepID=UPI0022B71105|nr:type I polyketide synthase [Streptomyces sp. WMMC897]MCZ7414352.1 beta-ketoacyl synthase N-terminal-like domain-containing protein [Streptomyces sp. WMMC897]